MDASSETLAYRVGRLEAATDSIANQKADKERLVQVERDTEALALTKADKDAVAIIATEVKGLRKMLLTFSLTVAGSAILICATILEVALRSTG